MCVCVLYMMYVYKHIHPRVPRPWVPGFRETLSRQTRMDATGPTELKISYSMAWKHRIMGISWGYHGDMGIEPPRWKKKPWKKMTNRKWRM